MNAVLTVARREVITKLTDKAFVIGSLLLTAIIVGLLVVQSIVAGGVRDERLAATPDSVQLANTVAAQSASTSEELRITVVPVADEAAARAALEADEVDSWLRKDGTGWRLAAKDLPDSQVVSAVDTAVRGPSAVLPESVSGNADGAILAAIMAFAISFLFYISSLVFGYTLANSVVEEKQSRIVEIIATKIPVRALLAGKVLGNTVLAVGQMAMYVGIGLIGLSFTKYSQYLPGLSGPMVWFIVFFLVGFVLLACLWAVAGALASRLEDIQSTGSPLTFLVLAVFFGAALLSGTPMTVMSFVPPFSAVLMPTRLLEGSAAWWEATIALALLVAAAGLVVLVAERLYRRALLQTQGRVSITAAWKAKI